MRGFRGHPSGLYVLFATEFWERYGFYSLAAILTLYMDEHLGFSQQLSGQVYGGYLAGVYFMPLFGGFLADRLLGYNRSVMIGPVLMDGIWYRIRERADAEKVLEQHIIGGKPVKELIHRTVNPPTGRGVQPPPAHHPVAS